MRYLIMCRSLTSAQRSASLLEKGRISAAVVKAPQSLSVSGCGYAVSIYKDFDEAVKILRTNNLLNGKRFMQRENGEYQEV